MYQNVDVDVVVTPSRMPAMGVFNVDIDVLASGGEDAERHLVLVDTGASYLSLPGSVLRRLGYR